MLGMRKKITLRSECVHVVAVINFKLITTGAVKNNFELLVGRFLLLCLFVCLSTRFLKQEGKEEERRKSKSSKR